MKNRFGFFTISKYIPALIFANMLVFACISKTVLAAEDKNENYSGVYKGNYQLIPNSMASLCKISADDIVQDSFKLRDCVDSLIIKRRSSDTEVAREGLKDLNLIKADEISEMMSLAIIRGAEIADYYTETSQKTDEINADAKTVNDIEGASVNTNQLLASVINSFRDIYVEQLKYLAISNIENMERDVLEDIAAGRREQEQKNKEKDKKNNGNGDEVIADVTVVEAKEVITEQQNNENTNGE